MERSPPLLIPHSVALPEVNLYKDNKAMSQSEEVKENHKVVKPKLSSWMDDQVIENLEMEDQEMMPEANTLNGSISNQLQRNSDNKRKPSPTINTNKKPKNDDLEILPVGIPTMTNPHGSTWSTHIHNQKEKNTYKENNCTNSTARK